MTPPLNKQAGVASWCGAIASVALILLAWGWIFWGIQRHFGVGIQTDVENDYVGNAMAVSAGENPRSFRHPGTPLYILLGHALRGRSLDAASVQTVLNRCYVLSMILLCLFTLLLFYRLRYLIQDPWAAVCWIPIGFLLPSTLYYFQVFSGEMLMWPWATLVLVLSVPVFFESPFPRLVSLVAWGIALGIGCGIRFPFIPLVGLGLLFAGIRAAVWERREPLNRWLWAPAGGMALYVLIGFMHYHWRGSALVYLTMNAVAGAVIYKVKSLRRPGLAMMTFGNAVVFGYFLATNAYFIVTLDALRFELRYVLPQSFSAKLAQARIGLGIVSLCAPAYLGLCSLILPGTAALSAWRVSTAIREGKKDFNLALFLLFLSLSTLAIGFSGLIHPYMSFKAMAYGVPMRMILLTAPLTATIFILLPGLLIWKKVRLLFRALVLAILPLSFVASSVCIGQMTQATANGKRLEGEINALIADYAAHHDGILPRTLFMTQSHGPANLFYASRQYGDSQGHARLRAAYPTFADVNMNVDNLKRNIDFSKVDLYITEKYSIGDGLSGLQTLGPVNVQDDGLVWVPLPHKS